MKRASAIVVLCLSSLAWGHEVEPVAPRETLFGSDMRVGGYAAPAAKLSGLSGAGGLVGGRAAVVINDFFSVGAEGYRWVAGTKAGRELSYGYVGPFFELTFMADKLVHPGVVLGVGFGQSRYHGGYSNDVVRFVSIEPEVHAELNLSNYVRLAAGLSYRFGLGEEQGLQNAGLLIALKVGRF